MSQALREYMQSRSGQGFCDSCGVVATMEEVHVEIPVASGGTVEGVPAGRCPGCGRIYHDVFLNGQVEEIAQELPVGRIRFVHLLGIQ